MEKAKTRKIKKWDEVHGEYETEVSENMGGSSPEEAAGAPEIVSDDKKSVLEKLREQSRQIPVPVTEPERKPLPGCCFEREITGW